MPLKIVCVDCESEDIELVRSGVPIKPPGCSEEVLTEEMRCRTCGAEWYQFAVRLVR